MAVVVANVDTSFVALESSLPGPTPNQNRIHRMHGGDKRSWKPTNHPLPDNLTLRSPYSNPLASGAGCAGSGRVLGPATWQRSWVWIFNGILRVRFWVVEEAGPGTVLLERRERLAVRTL